MTNSTDNSPVEAPQPKKKKSGPIRTGLVLPAAVLFILLGVYFSLFFDHNLRRGLEYVLTHVNGAEVNIGRLRTSFIHANLEINDVEVTDKAYPERNIVRIGAIKFEMLWDALLRAKIVVDEASILNIEALSPRKHPGYVIPPTPPDNKPSQLQKVEQEAAAQAQKKYNGNFLGDVAGLLKGGDPKDQLKNLEGQLKSDAKIKELQRALAEKKIEWDKRIKALPQAAELEVYNTRIKALKFDFKNPSELAKNVQEAQKILSEAQGKVKLIDQTQKDLKADVGNYTQQYKDLEKMVQEDLHDLQGRLKLPNIDAKEFSQQLFMSLIEKKLGSVAKYITLARHYMPPKKTPEQKKELAAEQIVPPKRGAGKTYHFPITTGYPLFWLKHAAISSQMNGSEYSGNIKGEIRDVTTDPAFLGKPILMLLTGEFPKQDIRGLDARITLDHTTEVAKETAVFKIARFPVTGLKLSDSPDVRLGLNQAHGSSEMHAQFVNDEITMSTRNEFSDVKFDVAAKELIVQNLIDAVLKGIPTVTVNADVTGSLHSFDVHINSNLGEELSKGFQKQLQAKIQLAQASLKKMIDDKIGGNREQLKSQIDKLTGDLTKNVDGKKGEADKVIKDTQNSMNAGKSGGGKSLEDQGKQLLKGLGL